MERLSSSSRYPQLWLSDGRRTGTSVVTDRRGRPLRVVSSGYGDLAMTDDRVFFVADDGRHGAEVWSVPIDGPVTLEQHLEASGEATWC